MSKEGRRQKYALHGGWPVPDGWLDQLYSGEQEMLRRLAEGGPNESIRGAAEAALAGDYVALLHLHDHLIEEGWEDDPRRTGVVRSVRSLLAYAHRGDDVGSLRLFGALDRGTEQAQGLGLSSNARPQEPEGFDGFDIESVSDYGDHRNMNVVREFMSDRPQTDRPRPYRKRKYALQGGWATPQNWQNETLPGEVQLLHRLAEHGPTGDIRSMAAAAIGGDFHALIQLHDFLLDDGWESDPARMPVVRSIRGLMSYAVGMTDPERRVRSHARGLRQAERELNLDINDYTEEPEGFERLECISSAWDHGNQHVLSDFMADRPQSDVPHPAHRPGRKRKYAGQPWHAGPFNITELFTDGDDLARAAGYGARPGDIGRLYRSLVDDGDFDAGLLLLDALEESGTDQDTLRRLRNYLRWHLTHTGEGDHSRGREAMRRGFDEASARGLDDEDVQVPSATSWYATPGSKLDHANRHVLGEYMTSRGSSGLSMSQGPAPSFRGDPRVVHHGEQPRQLSRRKMGALRSPAGGVVVRGIHYPGGKFIPASGPEKTTHDKYQAIHAHKKAQARYQRSDGSCDFQAACDDGVVKYQGGKYRFDVGAMMGGRGHDLVA